MISDPKKQITNHDFQNSQFLVISSQILWKLVAPKDT